MDRHLPVEVDCLWQQVGEMASCGATPHTSPLLKARPARETDSGGRCFTSWLTSASARPLTFRHHRSDLFARNFMARPPVCAPISVNGEERR